MFKLQPESTRARFVTHMLVNRKREQKVLDFNLKEVKAIQDNLCKLYLDEYNMLSIVEKAAIVVEITKLQKVINLKQEIHRDLPIHLVDKRPLTNIEIMVALMEIDGCNELKALRPDEQH